MRLGVPLALVIGLVLTGSPADLSAQITPPAEGSRGAAARAAGPEMRPPSTPAGVDMSTTQYGLEPGRPRVTPYRTDTPPVIDANLDDPVWARAAYLNEFTQESPNDGAPATEETEIWIAYDEDHIYFACYAHYSDLGLMRANLLRRDRANVDDLCTIYFDTFLDQQRGYDFDVNGYGVQGDGLMSVGGRGGGRGGGGGSQVPPADRSWDALFETAGQPVEDGYVAEMAIPFKSLRFPSPPDGEPHRWGFQIVREVKSKGPEQIVWSPMSRSVRGFFTQMGILEGMTDISQTRNIEVLPTAVAIQHGEIDPTRPGFVNESADPDFGVNLKYGITPNMTADFTVNPDFSQIESDRGQIETNLRFPISFRELRPFFVEGSEIFNISAPVTIVHTRTIVDPDYGAKVSGQLGRFTLGVLTANDVAPGNVDDPNDPARDETAQTFIARAQYDLFPESNVGMFFTDREFDTPANGEESHSRLYGLDSNIRFNSTISGDLRLVRTDRRALGDEEAVDGHLLSGRLTHAGRTLNLQVTANQVSPDFRTDVGFVRRRDQRVVNGSAGLRFWPAESVLVNWGPSVDYGRLYDFSEVLQDENLGAGINFTFVRNIGVGANLSRNTERFGGTEYEMSGFSVRGNVNARQYSFGTNFSKGESIFFAEEIVGDSFRWSVNGSFRPSDRMQTGLNYTSSRLTDPRRGDLELFDVEIIRFNTNFQFTERLGFRNIVEYSTQEETLDFNLLAQYQVNAGTVFYLGYDDHYQQADLIEGDRDGDGVDEYLFQGDSLRRINRAIFFKAQYLLRY